MLRCLQSPDSSFVGNGADMSVLERRREMQRRLQQQQQFPVSRQEYVHNSKFQSDELVRTISSQSSINDESMAQQKMSNWPINFDRCLESEIQNFGALFWGDCLGFMSCPPENANRSVEMDHNSLTSVSISSSTVMAPIATASPEKKFGQISSTTKKRKAELDAEEEYEDGRKEGDEGDDGEDQSEITTKSSSEKVSAGGNSKNNSKLQPPKTEYIHVRARRGQATDSHSIAERARREKIRKKMKCLQDLVPGCSKVTGKAGMLDEIINYVQSLQRQVEFLSMKLAALNPRLDYNHDNFFVKEFPAYMAGFSAADFANSAFFQCHETQKGGCTSDFPINPSQSLHRRIPKSLLPIPDAYLDSSGITQIQSLLTRETDLQSLYAVNLR